MPARVYRHTPAIHTNLRNPTMKKSTNSLLLIEALAILILCLLLCPACLSSLVTTKPSQADTPGNGPSPSYEKSAPFKPGEILVKFRPNTAPRTIRAVQERFHLETLRILQSGRLYLMKIRDGTRVENMAERLKALKAVEYAEPNYIRTTQ